MKFIKPVSITDAVLVSSSVPEADHAAWDGATSYAVGARVIRLHRIWEALAANTGAAPESSPEQWIDVAPTARWAAFDSVVGTATAAAGKVEWTLAPGLVNAIALLNVAGASEITLTLTVGGETVWARAVGMADKAFIGDFYDYLFADPDLPTTALVGDVPPYRDGHLTVSVTGPATVSVGLLVVGSVVDVGEDRYGASPSIKSYSQKTVDRWGNTVTQKGAWARNPSFPVWVPNGRLDYVMRRLIEIDSTPVVWIGYDGRYECLTTYGIYQELRPVINYPTETEMVLTIEGYI